MGCNSSNNAVKTPTIRPIVTEHKGITKHNFDEETLRSQDDPARVTITKKSKKESLGPSIPRLGVKVSYLKEFVKRCGNSEAIQDNNVYEVFERFIRPSLTVETSFCDVLQSEGPFFTGEAQIYISFAWKSNFLATIRAIEEHYASRMDTFIWMDIFSNPILKGSNTDIRYYSHSMKDFLREFQEFGVVFTRFDHPTPMFRTWCLFEIYCATIAEVSFDIIMTDDQKQLLFESLANNGITVINSITSRIDISDTMCNSPTEKESILQYVKSTEGCSRFNSLIVNRLRDFMVSVLEKELANLEQEARDHGESHEHQNLDIPKRVVILSTLGKLYETNGDYAVAEQMLRAGFNLCAEELGETMKLTWKTRDELAALYVLQGDHTYSV